MDINGRPPRGAFDIRKKLPGEFPTYPALWTHSAERERRLVVETDTCSDPRQGLEEKASATWRQQRPDCISMSISG